MPLRGLNQSSPISSGQSALLDGSQGGFAQLRGREFSHAFVLHPNPCATLSKGLNVLPNLPVER
jgi:hypothetical protein